MVLQDRVKEYLKENGIMHKWFADKAGISPPVLSMWLRDKASLSYSTREKIRAIVDRENNN